MNGTVSPSRPQSQSLQVSVLAGVRAISDVEPSMVIVLEVLSAFGAAAPHIEGGVPKERGPFGQEGTLRAYRSDSGTAATELDATMTAVDGRFLSPRESAVIGLCLEERAVDVAGGEYLLPKLLNDVPGNAGMARAFAAPRP